MVFPLYLSGHNTISIFWIS